jgi:hypothetical protein
VSDVGKSEAVDDDSRRSLAIEQMMERFGGREAFWRQIDSRYEEFTRVWNQDPDRMGRILRAHLAVEHFVGMYLSAANPNLGDIAAARLTYAQKVDLLKAEENGMVAMILPGLRRIGAIRNRIAHRLQVELTKEDEDLFLSIGLFKAMRTEQGRDYLAHPEVKVSADDARLAVVEEFAQFASGMLHSGADPGRDAWAEAMKTFAQDHQEVAKKSA